MTQNISTDIGKERIGWDEYFIQIAELTAKRSTCIRRQVGAVITLNNRIISTGYNGAPTGVAHCVSCLRQELNIPSGERLDLCMAAHAEQNAIIGSALNQSSPEGGTIYVTVSPCFTCLKMILNSKIKRIVTRSYYPDELSKRLLDESGIEIVLLPQKGDN